MPKILEIEPTPNPNAMKFILKEPLTYGVTRSYDNAEQAINDPLATELFQIPHVTSVFYVDHWITVTQNGKAEWPELLKALAVPIRAAKAGDEAEPVMPAGSKAETVVSEADQGRLIQINELLDEKIRPYLQGDGGDLEVVSLDGDRLMVHYQGACGSCPSSLAGTLAAVENLLHTIEPNLEVIAV
jgi:Fe-S cluster biogenesis protein NfuA